MADTVVHLVTLRGKNIKKLVASAVAAFFLLSVTVGGVLAMPWGDRVQKVLNTANLNELYLVPSRNELDSHPVFSGEKFDSRHIGLLRKPSQKINAELGTASFANFSKSVSVPTRPLDESADNLELKSLNLSVNNLSRRAPHMAKSLTRLANMNSAKNDASVLTYIAEGIITSVNDGAVGSAVHSATVDPWKSSSSVQPVRTEIDSAKQSSISESRNRTYLDVPVPFLSDRNNQLSTKDAYKKHSVDQVIGSKHVWLGVAHVAVWANDLATEDLAAAERWGCKRISYKEAHKPNYTHFEKQLKDTGLTVCIPSLKDENECHPFKNEQYTSFHNTVTQLLESSDSKQYLIFLHGCCTSQKMALEQTAAMALAFRQPVIAFDWATVGPINAPPLPEVNTYRRSERALEISQGLFDLWMNELLKDVPPQNVSLFAHSMGNRIVKDYLLKQNDRFGKLKQVHLIRPDMSAQPFFMQKRTITKLANETFVYYANNDPWLSWSAAASASVPRLGRMEDLIDRVKEEGVSYGPPGCSFLIDISSMGHKHQIPEHLIKDVWKNGIQSEILSKRLIREIPDRDRILRVAVPQRNQNQQ